MSKRSLRPIEIVSHRTQNEQQRLAMIMMQLDMALAVAREKGMTEVEAYLEDALAKARIARRNALQ